tara:strand:- start:1230 stop:1697 length:468 start_codon:yes stop_codon:yes gene_type:complete
MRLKDKILEIDKNYDDFEVTTLGNYIPLKQVGNLIYISGQLPLVKNQLITGKVPTENSINTAKRAAKICMLNTLSILDQIYPMYYLENFSCIHIAGYINAESSFEDHPKIINGASDVVCEILSNNGKHSRIAVGCASLPKNASVEISSIFSIIEK